MESAHRVCVFERVATGEDEFQSLCERDVLLHPGVQRMAGNQLHAHEPDVAIIVQVKHSDDSRVAETLHLPKLALQSQQRVLVDTSLREQHFESDGAIRTVLV